MGEREDGDLLILNGAKLSGSSGLKWSFREMYTFKEEDMKLQLMAGTAQRLCRCL